MAKHALNETTTLAKHKPTLTKNWLAVTFLGMNAMHLLAYWRIDNYLNDLDDGAGFNYNSRQSRLHSQIDLNESLWLFTALRNPPRLYLAARLVIRAKTVNPSGYKYGQYRVWGEWHRSRYFK